VESVTLDQGKNIVWVKNKNITLKCTLSVIVKLYIKMYLLSQLPVTLSVIVKL
jgi:hypothetical protein